MDEYTREPCPWRITDDCGGAFAMGAVGGSLFGLGKGMINAPKGLNHRLISGFRGLRTTAPRVGGQFAIWGLTFSSCDCTLAYMRRKEDAWNSIMSGFITGGILTFRAGPVPMLVSASIGGLLLAMIEGVGIMMNRLAADQFRPTNPQEDPSLFAPPPESAGAVSEIPVSEIPASSLPFGSANLN